MEWLSDHGWLGWLALSVGLGVVEVTRLDLVFLMLVAGALGGATTAIFGGVFVVQVAVALTVSVLMLAVVRPAALGQLRRAALEARTGVAALVGRRALVLERVDAHAGRVKLGGEVWLARSHDPASAIGPGRTVDVVSIDGATAVVLATDL